MREAFLLNGPVLHLILDLQRFQQNLQPQPFISILQVYSQFPLNPGDALQQRTPVDIQAVSGLSDTHIFVQIGAECLNIADTGDR